MISITAAQLKKIIVEGINRDGIITVSHLKKSSIGNMIKEKDMVTIAQMTNEIVFKDKKKQENTTDVIHDETINQILTIINPSTQYKNMSVHSPRKTYSKTKNQYTTKIAENLRIQKHLDYG